MTSVSLILPAKNEASRLFLNLQDLAAFLRKFPLQMEVILVMDPSHDSTRDESQKYAKHLADSGNSQISLTLLQNKKDLGRGRSVEMGLREAHGDVILVSSLGWPIPLAEIFRALQEILSTPGAEVVIGNRNTSRKKRTARRSSWYWTLENLINEKLRRENLRAQDPLSPLVAFKKEALAKILAPAEHKGNMSWRGRDSWRGRGWRGRGWFYTPDLLRAASQLGLAVREIPILSNDLEPSRIPLVKEYLRHLF
jgi:hypothetical protein